jgi:UDP-glucose 4-epimerase
VTGGAGFIGSHLCDALLESNNAVTCVDNLLGTAGSTRNVEHLLAHPRFELVTDDILEWAERADLAGIDCIFHLAASKHAMAMRDPERDLLVNGLGTLRLLLRAAGHGVPRFVHGSTGSVFGETTVAPAEDAPKIPVSHYGISKLAGETYCRLVGDRFGLDYTILRYYSVIGPRQDDSARGGVVPIFVRRCLAGRPLTIYGTGAQTRSFTSVHDVVRVTLLAAVSDAMRRTDFNCGSGVSVTVQDLAEFVVAETWGRPGIEYVAARPGDIEKSLVDNAKLNALGVTFDTDWRAAVRAVIESLREPVSARDASVRSGRSRASARGCGG